MVATRREAMKLQTRQRVVDAARALFSEKGYSAATIREIAVRAGVSTGSVFTTFCSKEDILSVIIMERQEHLIAAINRARTECSGDARARLKAALAASYAYEFERLMLVLEQIGASWTWSKEFERANTARLVRSFDFIHELLREAQGEGILPRGCDLALAGDLLLGAYLRNFRHARFHDWTLDQTVARAHAAVDVIFNGLVASPHEKKP